MIKFKTKTPVAAQLPKALAPKVVPPDTPDDEPLFVIKDFPQNHVLYHIHKANPPPRPPRPHNVVHASDLDPARAWCPREPALLTKTGKTRPTEFVSTAQRMTWSMGYKGADLLMDLIPDKMQWGSWKCRSCSHEQPLCYKPEKCSGCGGSSKALRYVEIFLRDPETQLVGSVDLFVDILGNGMKTPIEIKTEGNEGFKKRTKPEFDHEWRTMLYLWLIQKTPQLAGKGLNHQEGRVLYFTKEGWADSPKIKEWKLGDWAKSAVKEYFVQRNDGMLFNSLEQVKTYRAWRTSFDGGYFPGEVPLPDRICNSPIETRAKNCAVCKECFG